MQGDSRRKFPVRGSVGRTVWDHINNSQWKQRLYAWKPNSTFWRRRITPHYASCNCGHYTGLTGRCLVLWTDYTSIVPIDIDTLFLYFSSPAASKHSRYTAVWVYNIQLQAQQPLLSSQPKDTTHYYRWVFAILLYTQYNIIQPASIPTGVSTDMVIGH